MSKKVILMVLSLSIAMSVVGCGTKEESNPTTQETVSSNTEQALPDDEPEKEEVIEVLEVDDTIKSNTDGTFLLKIKVRENNEEEIVYYRVNNNSEILNEYKGIAELEYFINGKAIAKAKVKNPDPSKNDEIYQYGVINTEGEWIVEPMYNTLVTNGDIYCGNKEQFDDFGSLGNNVYVFKSDKTLILEEKQESSFDAYGEYVSVNEKYVSRDGTIYEEQPIEPNRWEEEKSMSLGSNYRYYRNNQPTNLVRDYSNMLTISNDCLIGNADGSSEMFLYDLDGNLLTTKGYKNISSFGNDYFVASEMREDGSAGFNVLLDKNGQELITSQAKITIMYYSMNKEYVVHARNDSNEEVEYIFNIKTLDMIEKESFIREVCKNIQNRVK